MWVNIRSGAGKESTNTNDQEFYTRNGALQIRTEFFRGFVDLDRGQGELVLYRNSPEYEIENYLRALFAWLGYKSGGLILHAAGIRHYNAVYLFTGHSGSGKSTVSRLSELETVLNDDLVLLMPDEENWRVYATPFWNPGWVKLNHGSGLLQGIFRLIKDDDVAIHPMEQALAVAELISNVPVIPACESCSAGLLNRVIELTSIVDVNWLHFRKDETFWEVLR